MEYEVISIPVSDGTEKEFAIIDKFEYKSNKYMAVSLVEGDEIKEGIYIYGYTDAEGDDINVEMITDAKEYEAVSLFYINSVQK